MEADGQVPGDGAPLGALALVSLLALGCSAVEPVTVLDDVIERGDYLTHLIPPLVTGCYRWQAGFIQGDYSVEPPIPATVQGSEQPCRSDEDCRTTPGEICRTSECRRPYDILADPFCSVASTYRFSRTEGRPYWDQWIYAIDMGTPTGELSEDALAYTPAATGEGGSGFYCHFRWRIDRVEPVEMHGPRDIVLAHRTLEEVSHFCSKCFRPNGYCAEDSECPDACVGEDGERLIDADAGYLFRASSERMVMWVGTDSVVLSQRDHRFEGFVGLPETGGAIPWDPGGWTFFYQPCEPTPSRDGVGPGVCTGAPFCRYFSGTNTLDQCDWWQHVRALPASPALVHPEWRAAYPDIYAEVYGDP